MPIMNYLTNIYDQIAASRKLRGKPCPSFSEWFAEVNHLAAVARATALGVE